MNMDRLYNLSSAAIRPRDAASDARAWLLDCFADDADDIRMLNQIQLVQSVETHYDGGYLAFLADSGNRKAPIVCEHCGKGPHDDGFPPIYSKSEAIDLGWSRTADGLLDEECASDIASNDYPREGCY